MKKHDNSKMNLSYIFLGLLTTLALKLNLDVIQGNNMEEIFPNIFLENIIIDIIVFAGAILKTITWKNRQDFEMIRHYARNRKEELLKKE
ncbi:MAG: hypothetical protein SPH40_03410 [Anaerobutyricum soehngenii]|nr:hypothetical protein [Anaerobutyricum soehngenii]